MTTDRHASAQPKPIPFGRLWRVEWTKATGTRAARWLLALIGLSTVAITLAPLLAPSRIEQTFAGYLSFAAAPLSILLPVVSILTLTSEWSSRSALATFTLEPRRLRVLGAKMVVAAMMSGLAALFGGLVTAAGLGVASVSGREVDTTVTAELAAGFVVFMLVNVYMAVALGALLHSSAAAIVASFVLPTTFAGLGQASDLIAKWIDPSTSLNWLLRGEWWGHVTPIAVALVFWIALPLTAGLFRTAHRDVT